MKEFVKIYLCADCAYYSLKKHKCTRGAKDEGDPQSHFYRDCPLGIHEEDAATAAPREEYDRLVAKVKAMRDVQKEYFKSRRLNALTESKQLENEVDALVKKALGTELTLFPQ